MAEPIQERIKVVGQIISAAVQANQLQLTGDDAVACAKQLGEAFKAVYSAVSQAERS